MTRKVELVDGWEFSEASDYGSDAWLPVKQVPGSIYQDLQHNGVIEDPFIDMNELNARWVPERTWKYRTSFQSPAAGSGAKAELVFEGLDTLATVFLNGQEVLKADNMFLEYRVNISDRLNTSRANNLEIQFSSAMLRGRDLVKEHTEHRFIAHQTEAGRLPIRKAQYHWGWDWGPILVDVGIWKPVYLETFDVRIEELWHQSNISEDLSVVSGKLFANVDGSLNANVQISLSLDGHTVFESTAQCNEDGLASCDFTLDKPNLWYPHGYGPQTRYQLKATLKTDDNVTLSKLIGFRRAQLIQEPDEHGTSFYFRINNTSIFCGGSCWIPADSMLGTMTPTRYHDWLNLLIAGNQIMIRVWGGGIYESTSFYSLCDSLGILVFQDFCFACQSTPAYPSFLSQITAEATFQIRHLRTHPSLVLWAGNNEDYQIQEKYHLDYAPDDPDPESWLHSSFPARYIYEHHLPSLLSSLDPAALYHPSSPWGKGKQYQPADDRWTTDPTIGDLHQWHIWHGTMNRHQQAPQMSGRFVSEFGMEAYPHLETLRACIKESGQLVPGSVLMDHRNRAIDHERRLMSYVVENFGVGGCGDGDVVRFGYLTQLVQADTMRSCYGSWRRQWGDEGRRKCGGVLVWQLNDCWPTVSWAVVDYFGVPKPGWYAIKRALGRVVVGVQRPYRSWTMGHSDPSVVLAERGYEVWVASQEAVGREVDLEIRFVSVGTGTEVAERVTRRGVKVRENGTTEVVKGEAEVEMQELAHEKVDEDDPSTFVVNQAGYFKYPTRHKKGVKPFDLQKHDPYVIHAQLTDSRSGEILSTDTAWPDPLKYLQWTERGVKVEIVGAGDKMKITTEKPVKGFVFQEKKGCAQLSDNGFDVMPGEEKIVSFERSMGDGKYLRWTYLGAASGEERL
jgi:beta-mannosidase